MSTTTDWLAQQQVRIKRRRNKLAAAKAVLVKALKLSRVATVIVEYDGEGDSGQVNDIVATTAGGNPAKLRGSVVLDLGDNPCRYDSLAGALDALTWVVLDLYHDGFENNEGGFGTLEIDVRTGKVTLDHNDRIIEVSNTLTEV
jgi:hypothetical protein